MAKGRPAVIFCRVRAKSWAISRGPPAGPPAGGRADAGVAGLRHRLGHLFGGQAAQLVDLGEQREARNQLAGQLGQLEQVAGRGHRGVAGAQGVLHQLAEALVGQDALAVGQAAAHHPQAAQPAGGGDLVEQAGFAEAGFPFDQQGLGVAGHHQLEPAEDLLQLDLAADQRHVGRRAGGGGRGDQPAQRFAAQPGGRPAQPAGQLAAGFRPLRRIFGEAGEHQRVELFVDLDAAHLRAGGTSATIRGTSE